MYSSTVKTRTWDEGETYKLTKNFPREQCVLRPRTKDNPKTTRMKSQDIFLLLKLLSIEKLKNQFSSDAEQTLLDLGSNTSTWQDWDTERDVTTRFLSEDLTYSENWLANQYSVRALAESTGISKTEVSASINRSNDIGLLKQDRYTSLFIVNKSGLLDFMIYGMKYVFPARPGELTRGISTSIGAPVFINKLMSAGDLIPVWPDPTGRTMGLSINPLFKTVPYAVKRDPRLYAFLAITDALRLGKQREFKYAASLLESLIK